MWQIHFRVPGEQALRIESVATETEMLTAVREKFREAVVHVVSPGGQQIAAAQAGLLSMLHDAKAHNVPARPSATLKRMLAPEQVRLPRLPGSSNDGEPHEQAARPEK